ncbi:hypothetical protein Dimus_039229 [Dionaea muscipula]
MALLSQFAGFLADANPETNQGILLAFLTALEIGNLHDLWVIDSGATDHMSNKLTKFHDFKPFSMPSFVSVADGKGAPVAGKGKINLVSDTVASDVLYVPSFLVQLLFVKRLTSTLNCKVIFTPSKVIFRDLATKETIGKGFHLHGLYYFSPSHRAFLSAISTMLEPRNFQEAHSQVVWRDAMDAELRALHENNTWSVVPLPRGKHVVGSRWIFKNKFNANGTFDRHKARLVAQGFTQKYGIDYKETFAPVAKMTTVRVLLSVAINNGWSLTQMDVKNAFLQGDLEEEVFMKLPPRHPLSGNSNLVCKLHKSIYGLKQSPRAWHAKLSAVLEDLGFTRSFADSSLYVRLGQLDKLVTLIYVDDLIIVGNNTVTIAQFKKKLQQYFPLKDLGPLKYFLGIEVATSSKGLFLTQHKLMKVDDR